MEITGTLRDTYAKAARDTAAAARNYWLNSAFLAGHQWLAPLRPGDSTSDIRSMPASRRIQLVDNRMSANHRTVMSNTMQRELEFSVRPNGADDASQQAAYVATEVCYFLRDQHNWEKLREDLAVTMLKGGTGGLAVDWDEEASDTIDTPLTIAEFVVEPGVRQAEFARWWIRAQLLNPYKVKEMYGLKKVPPADAAQGLNPLQRELLSNHMGEDFDSNLTLVLTYYERPNKENEKGRVAVEVDRKILEDNPWPFPFTDRLNLSVGHETRNETRWYGDTTYTQARSPQVGLNVVQSGIAEHIRDTSASKMLVPHSAVQLMDAMTDVPGNMYPYPDGLAPPQWMNPPQLAAWFREAPGDYRRSIDDAMGVHDVSRGRAPANLESGTAISILAEMDGTPNGKLLKEITRIFANHARLSLMMHEKLGNGKKRFAVVQTEAGPLSVHWTGKDIGNQYSVTVPEDSIRPRSAAAQAQIAMKLLEMGVITTMAEFVRYSEAPGFRELLDVMEPAVAKARRNHASMVQGEAVIPDEFDDFATLIAEGNKFRMTTTYEKMDGEGQETVGLYIQACETLAAEQAANAQARTQASSALGSVPRADGAPPVAGEEILPPAPGPATVEPEPADLLGELTAGL